MDITQQAKIASHQSTEQLKQRISQGRRWLIENTDSPKYKDHLKLYEILVEEVRRRGLKEEECWTVENLGEEEIEDIFTPQKRLV